MNERNTQQAISASGVNRHAVVLLVVSVLLAGCGGGGGGSERPMPQSASEGSSSSVKGAGTVSVKVVDVFNEAVGGATVHVNSRTAAGGLSTMHITEANGRVTVINVPSGTVWVAAEATSDESIEMFGLTEEVQLENGGQHDFAVTVQPTTEMPAVGLGKASGVVTNGDVLEFTLPLFSVPRATGFQATVTLGDCAPDPSNDRPVPTPDCIAGPAGFDADYRSDTPPTWTSFSEGGGAAPFSAALLLDQSRNILVSDPSAGRLFGIRYLLSHIGGTAAHVALSGFAADDPPSGETSLLPAQPVTVFPVEDPRFHTADAIVATIDTLAGLEGGAAPLSASIDQMLGFTSANAPIGERRALVVLTDGQDETCGAPADCRAAQQVIAEKSRATGVQLVVIGLDSVMGNTRSMNELTQASNGVVFWVQNPTQLAVLFGGLGDLLDGSAAPHNHRFRIESSTVGAFASGRTVLGTVRFERCPWYCYEASVPIAIQIP